MTQTPPDDQAAQRSSKLRRLAVLVLGGVVLVGGLALLVLPGPGFIVVAVGLAILATEFAWAERYLGAARARAHKAAETSASSVPSIVFTVLFAIGLIVVGGLTFTDVFADLEVVGRDISGLLSPWTGGVLLLSGVFLVGLTVYTRRQLVQRGARGEGPLARG